MEIDKEKLKRLPSQMLKYSKEKSYKSKEFSKSLFDDMEYDLEKTPSKSSFIDAYEGKTTEFDNISLEREYWGREESSKAQKLFEDSDYEMQKIFSNSEFSKVGKEMVAIRDSTFSHDGTYRAKERKNKNSTTREDVDIEEFLVEKYPSPFIKSNLCIEKEEVKEEAENIALPLAIAENFIKLNRVILVNKAMWIYNGRFYTLLTEDMAQKLIFQKYRKEVSRVSPYSTIKNAVALLKFCVKEELEEFPINDKIIVFANGTLELETGNFRKNSAEDFANSALGINYDPKQREMPYTKKFLQTIADGDVELFELMLQVIGYVLSNDVRAKSFFYLEGVGDAGKSRFCDLIASFFPVSGANKVARIALQDLGGKFALGNLVNSKLNISEDLPDSPLSPTTVSRIKMISDSNRLEAEAKYVQPFSFRPTCKLLFASNHPLRLKEYDAAFVNRVVYIPFLNAIPKHKQDKNILEKMQGELPALFNYSFVAYKKLVRTGYSWSGAERFKPEISITNSGISIDKKHVLKQFVDVCCVIDENATSTVADLQAAYDVFCCNNKFLPIIGDRFSRELAGVLPDMVSRVKIGNQRRGFKGIRLKE